MVEKLRAMKLRDAADLVSAGIEETLSYYEIPHEHGAVCGPTIRWNGSTAIL